MTVSEDCFKCSLKATKSPEEVQWQTATNTSFISSQIKIMQIIIVAFNHNVNELSVLQIIDTKNERKRRNCLSKH